MAKKKIPTKLTTKRSRQSSFLRKIEKIYGPQWSSSSTLEETVAYLKEIGHPSLAGLLLGNGQKK